MMMGIVLFQATLSFVLPFLAGWTLTEALWPSGTKLLRSVIGVGLGIGTAGAAWMAGLMLSNSSAVAFDVSEIVLLVLIATLGLFNARRRNRVVPFPKTSIPGSSRIEIAALVLVIMVSGFLAVMNFDVGRHGGHDARAIWNGKARVLYLGDHPMDLLADFQMPDYPLLLPGLIIRGWQYSGRNTVAVPITLALLFIVASVVVLIDGLRIISTSRTAALAGCAALGTPYFVVLGASQYADIVMCFFITAAIVLFLISDFTASGTFWLPLLSGLSAGMGACVKNEGSLFVVVILGARVALMIWNRHWKVDGVRIGLFVAGLAPFLLVLDVFRTLAPVPSVLIGSMTVGVIGTRVMDTARHLEILKGLGRNLVRFGNWWVNPLLPMLLYVIVQRYRRPAYAATKQAWFPAIVFAGMLCGYYGVYLFSPYEVVWHVETSISRLLIQLWPTLLLLWALLVAEKVEA